MLYFRKESTSLCNLCDVEKYSLFRGSFSSFCNCRQVLARGYFASILAWKSKKRTQVRLHLSRKKSWPEDPGGKEGKGGICPSTFGRFRKLMEAVIIPEVSWVRLLLEGMVGFPSPFEGLRTILWDWSHFSVGLYDVKCNPTEKQLVI